MEQTTEEKKIDVDFLNYLFISSIFLLLVASLIVNHVLAYVAFVVFSVGVCFLPEKIIICDLFFLMPFASIFKIAADSMSLFTICELMTLMVFFIKGNKVTFKILIAGATYVGYLVFCSLFAHQNAMIDLIKQGMNIALLFYFVRIYPTEEYRKLSLFFIAGMLLSSSVALFADSIPDFYEYVSLEKDYKKQIERFSGLRGDPNYYTVNSILAFSLLLVLYYKKDIAKILFWGCFAALSGFGLLTYSKSFLLMYAIICIVLLILTIQMSDRVGLGLLCLLGVGLIILAFMDGSVVNLTIERFLEADDLNSLTTNRSGLWKTYIKYLFANPISLLLGDGVSVDVIGGNESHNTCIDSVYRIGVFGVCLLVYAIICCFTKKEKVKKNKLNYFGLFNLGLMYFFLHILTAYDMIFQLYIAYIIYNIGFEKRSTNNESNDNIEDTYLVEETLKTKE